MSLRRYLPLGLGIAAYLGIVGAVLTIADRAGWRPAQAQVPVGATTTPLDLRVLGGPNLCAGGRNVVAFVDNAVASGVTDILIPPGCTYVPDGNITPADVTIEGGNWETSILQSSAPFAGPAGLDVSAGPRSIIKNIAIQGQFCLKNAAAALCPLVEFVNASDNVVPIQTFAGTGIIINSGNAVTFSGTTSTPATPQQTLTAQLGSTAASLVTKVAALPPCTGNLAGTRYIVIDAGFPVTWNGTVDPAGVNGANDTSPHRPGDIFGGNNGATRAPVLCNGLQWVYN